MDNPLATAVIDAARAYSDEYCDPDASDAAIRDKRFDLFDAVMRLDYDAAHPTTRGETLVVEGDGVTVR